MYEEFYKLTGRPFQLNPDPRFFYRSTGHKRAQAYMRYGLQQEQGFIVVTGDVGTGKTMLVNNLFKEIDESALVAAKIVSTKLKELDLLRLIAAEFDIPFERSSKATLLNHLETFFKACREDGKRVLLVIDEAQNLPHGALEELRMLSNFDHKGVPLVQSFLLGQREFRSVLRAPGLEQLRQRVIAAYHLKPLSVAEVKAYIEHRLHKVGWDNDPAIEEAVYERVFDATGGVPRRINTLFDRVLLNSFLDEKHAITVSQFATVWSEVEREQGDITDGDIVLPTPQPPEPVVQVFAPAPAAPEISDAVTEQLQNMQRTIETLSDKLQRAEEREAAMLASQRGMPPQVGERGFPMWTSMFVALMLLIVALGTLIGYWVTTR